MESGRSTLHTESRYYILLSSRKIRATFSYQVFFLRYILAFYTLRFSSKSFRPINFPLEFCMLSWPPLCFMHFPPSCFFFYIPNDLSLPFRKSSQNPSKHEPFMTFRNMTYFTAKLYYVSAEITSSRTTLCQPSEITFPVYSSPHLEPTSSAKCCRALLCTILKQITKASHWINLLIIRRYSCSIFCLFPASAVETACVYLVISEDRLECGVFLFALC